ncbi:flagellar assembly factor FliW [Vallitalea longa]|uniref:Flagellar assembly factor FliW n=1 Tax=Vallitalea longa TaxID=2936439 RepID=A0A9W5Y7P2_9FIRM|nr:flagellar assembly protein FliW [Vallitalea longa]GKX28480.1 flagellar assembly factor FliW [Vallitalea longa]
MLVETKYFGKIEIDKEQIITFEDGIFGFNQYHEYTILFANDILCWLQSVEDKDIVLPMIVTPLVFPDYSPDVDDELILRIGKLNQEDLVLYNIIVVPEDVEKMTTNLKAPIIINSKSNKGIQVILDSDEYNIKHNLYEHLKESKQKVGE